MTKGNDKMLATLSPADRLIVALDVNTFEEADELVTTLGDAISFYKVGWQLFMGTYFRFVKRLTELKKRIFLDLKIEDIPATVEQALKNVPDSLDVLELVTLKGASSIVSAAQKAKNGSSRVQFLMLTALSSMNDEDVQEIYGQDVSLDELVHHRTLKALHAKCDGVIASGDSVKKIRDWFPEDKWGKFLIVAPAIRPLGGSIDDHKRSLTPFEAARDGADYLVIGRPIRQSPNPRGMAEEMAAEAERGLKERARLTESRNSGKDGSNALQGKAASG